MVLLEKLVIEGFKSFKRKTAIPFPTGFSVITGPNGGGKSNITDAISFVLGRTSSRSLRAKKGHELIFHGGKNKPGAEFAKVGLFFDNSAKKLPFEEKSVSISRKINKAGVSTYRLNGKVVSRQQIVDLFSQFGVHPDGHNIIQQGDVTNVVELDPVGRREVIDEISGIAEYDEKKTKAMKEMEKIAEKVREAEILLQEKNQTMEKLRQERETAVRYQNMQADLEKIRQAIIWKGYTDSKKFLENFDREIESRNKEAEKLEAEIKKLDSEISEMESRMEEFTKEVMQASSQIEVSRKIAKLRSDIEIKRDRIGSNKREIDRLNSLVDRLRSLGKSKDPQMEKILGYKGVFGRLEELINVPKEYRIAVDVAGGGHLQDIVVDTTETAVRCIKYLKENKVGRARFLPLNRIKIYPKKPLPLVAAGWTSDLIQYEEKYLPAVNLVFGNTACVKDIEVAKTIKTDGFRIVTLDGDLFEQAGSITGGYYKPRQHASYDSEIKEYNEEKRRLEKEMEGLERQIKIIDEELNLLAEKEKKTKTFDLEKDRVRIDEKLKQAREARKGLYEKRLDIQQQTGKLNIKRAKEEAVFDSMKIQWESKKLENVKEKDLEPFAKERIQILNQKEAETLQTIQGLGPVNMKALQDFEILRREFDEFKVKVEKIIVEKQAIEDSVQAIEQKRKEVFMRTLNEIAKNFRETYKELTAGTAMLELEDSNNINSGLMIKAQPPSKKLLNIDSMSGGEKTLTAFAFLFAIQRYKPSPFYILDEADAALDAPNTKRVVGLLKKHGKSVQFIVISHNNVLVREADQIYGVSMEDGESKVIAIELPKENN